MPIEDRLEEAPANTPKLWADFNQWTQNNRAAIVVGQAQPALDSAYTSLDKALKGAFTPSDKKTDPNFNVSGVKIKGKKTEVYKTLNAFAEDFFNKLGYKGTIEASKEIKDEQARFRYFITRFDQVFGTSGERDYDPNRNPTLATLLATAETLLEDSEATVERLQEAVRVYKNNPNLANRSFGVKSGEKIQGLTRGVTSIAASLGLRDALKKGGIKVHRPEVFYDPAGSIADRISFYGAMKEGRADEVAQLAERLGLRYQPNLG